MTNTHNHRGQGNFTGKMFLKLNWPKLNLSVTLLAGLLWFGLANAKAASPASGAPSPRIVNLYNFIRNSDFRLKDSENVLFDCTRRQIDLLKSHHLPATWALQYDALINPRYQKLLKEQLGPADEIAAWWEIPRQMAEKAGLKWRGSHDWDPVANVGFSPGYLPEERRKLVDVYMAEFKSVFGFYPRTVGSWFIDEVTLEYMAGKYGVLASCNCKDQIGTDFYTLWGGYWNQAYYPSRVNAYMPAQTRRGQLNIPIFRMLGSDPIYQHGTTPGLQSLEPVYPESGGSTNWVAWFMRNMINHPSLAFAYTQAGQENSFGWEGMKHGLTHQMALFEQLAKEGKIRVETLEQTGRWFRKNYPLTPPTSVVVLDDYKNEDRKTVWYDSRFYRLNVLWEKGAFFIRDLHLFDERMVSPTHETPLKETSLAYETLPIVDWGLWSDSGKKTIGMFPVLRQPDGTTTSLSPAGTPEVQTVSRTDLQIKQPVKGGGTLMIRCAEKKLTFFGVDEKGRTMPWAWVIKGGEKQKAIVTQVTTDRVEYRYQGTSYTLKLSTGTCRQLADGSLLLAPGNSGKLVLEAAQN